jgi:acylphosphatase
MKKRAHIHVSGRVQGVYYRSYAQDAARALNLTGWVRNTRDGRVEMIVEGEEDKVVEMIDWCWKGSPSSRVSGVEVDWEEPSGGFNHFSIDL